MPICISGRGLALAVGRGEVHDDAGDDGRGGDLLLSAGDTTNVEGRGGDVDVASGLGRAASGDVDVRTASDGTTSGRLSLGTGSTSGASGSVTLETGDARDGDGGAEQSSRLVRRRIYRHIKIWPQLCRTVAQQ